MKIKCPSCKKEQALKIPKNVCLSFVQCRFCKERITLSGPVCG